MKAPPGPLRNLTIPAISRLRRAWGRAVRLDTQLLGKLPLSGGSLLTGLKPAAFKLLADPGADLLERTRLAQGLERHCLRWLGFARQRESTAIETSSPYHRPFAIASSPVFEGRRPWT